MRLICTQCGKEFDFSESEQKFYNENGYVDPKRCKECRKYYDGNKQGIKTSTFYQNSRLYGVKEDVAGGLYKETVYMVRLELNNNVVYVKNYLEGSTLNLVRNAVDAGKFDEVYAKNIVERLAGYSGAKNVTIEKTQVYTHIR